MNLNLNYQGYEKYLFLEESVKFFETGIHYIFKFENNYGASIIKHDGSYGYKEDLWELAVIKFINEDEWELCYSTEITDDVIGYLTDEEVRNILGKIKEI